MPRVSRDPSGGIGLSLPPAHRSRTCRGAAFSTTERAIPANVLAAVGTARTRSRAHSGHRSAVLHLSLSPSKGTSSCSGSRKRSDTPARRHGPITDRAVFFCRIPRNWHRRYRLNWRCLRTNLADNVRFQANREIPTNRSTRSAPGTAACVITDRGSSVRLKSRPPANIPACRPWLLAWPAGAYPGRMAVAVRGAGRSPAV